MRMHLSKTAVWTGALALACAANAHDAADGAGRRYPIGKVKVLPAR